MKDQSNHILTTSRDNTLKLIDLRMYETVHTFTHPEFRTGVNYLVYFFDCILVFLYFRNHVLVRMERLWFQVVLMGRYFSGIRIQEILNQVLLISIGNVFFCNTLTVFNSSSIVGVCWSPQGGNLLYSAEREKTVIFWGDSKSI